MSYEMTIANAKARAAEHEWKQHRAHCAGCTAGTGRPRKPELMCQQGAALRLAHRAAQDELADNRRLDKQPIKGEQPLWT